MVILFSGRNSKCEKEITEILKNYGAAHISDKSVNAANRRFTIISEYKKTDIKLKKGITVFIDDTDRFKGQQIPYGIIGICSDTDFKALSLLAESRIPVITCGMNAKSTFTVSSCTDGYMLTALQRILTDLNGNEIEPAEFKIKIGKAYTPFAVMASALILLLNGITPDSF